MANNVNKSNTHKKNVEPICHSFHVQKAFALPGSSKRATESPTLMLVYKPTSDLIHTKSWTNPKRWYTIHPMERPCCFVFEGP